MTKKKDILKDLMTGKATNCCGTCKNYVVSEDLLSQGIDGICKLEENKDDNFCFGFEICDKFENKDLNLRWQDECCSECNSNLEWTYHNGYFGLTCSNKKCWTHNLIYIDFLEEKEN